MLSPRFNLREIPIKEEIEQINTKQGRFYRVNYGDGRNIHLPSVTTVIGDSNYFDKTALIEWQERVGREEAKKIKIQAGIRGTALHRITENYIRGENYTFNEMPVNLDLFKDIKNNLDKHLREVFAIEYPLFSFKYLTAGKTDLIGKWKSKKSIIDLKTSRKIKKEEYILNYFVQATAYAMLFNEMFNENIEDIVILIAVDHEEPQIFEKKTAQYRDIVEKIFNKETLHDKIYYTSIS